MSTVRVPLTEVADVIRGVTYGADDASPTAQEGYLPILRAGNIQLDLNMQDGLVWIPASLVHGRQLVRENDIVMCTSSGSADVVGKIAKASHDWDGSFGAFCAVVRPRSGRAASSFLAHYFRSPDFRAWTQKSHGANIKNIRKSELDEFQLPLPPIHEQHRIAAILDTADAISKKRAAVRSDADHYVRSTFLRLFGDPAANSKGLPEKPIAEIATVTTGSTPSREVSSFYGNHIEWIKSDNINTPSHFLTKATEGLSEAGLRVGRSAPAGSTLITCIAGSPSCIGNAALADRPVSFNQQINALTPKPGIEPEFIYATTLFSKARIQAASTNGMKGMVSKGALEQVRFILPPPDQREKFVAIFRMVMALTEKLESAASEASMLYGSLAQRAFQGQLSGL